MTAPIGTPDQLGTVLQIGRQQRPDATSGTRTTGVESADATPFADQVREFVQGVNETQEAGSTMAEGFANGDHNDLHGTMIALQKADVTLKLAATVRNRALEAYREIMRMGA